jgi:UDP-N-acetylmuramate dehydrogenase
MRQSAFPVAVQENVKLASHTTLGIGGPARFFAEATTSSQVLEALHFAGQRDLPVFVLGGGSNLVVSDAGFPGLAVKIALRGVSTKKNGIVEAAAGEDWDAFVCRCVEHGLSGIECLSGIPGTVGGTPIQNVGAYGQEVAEAIVAVRVLDRSRQEEVDLSNQDCRFAYRTSIFNAAEKGRYIVLSVSFHLYPGTRTRIQYPDLLRHFADRTSPPGVADVRGAVLQIRAQKSMVLRPEDPNAKSAGSFFKNPLVAPEIAEQAHEAARRSGVLRPGEVMARYPMPDGSIKLSAAWLIEHAGFGKGYGRGRVAISSRHALALVNLGDASAEELLGLMREIQSGVQDRFGIRLAPEPVFVGFEAPIT